MCENCDREADLREAWEAHDAFFRDFRDLSIILEHNSIGDIAHQLVKDNPKLAADLHYELGVSIKQSNRTFRR